MCLLCCCFDTCVNIRKGLISCRKFVVMVWHKSLPTALIDVINYNLNMLYCYMKIYLSYWLSDDLV